VQFCTEVGRRLRHSFCRVGVTVAGRTKPEVRDRWTELLELEELLPQLVVTALKLPRVERRDSLNLIGRFRERIDAMKWAEVTRFSTMQTTG
jgi:hypothetical protein